MRYKYLFLLLFGLFLMGCVPSSPSATGTMRALPTATATTTALRAVTITMPALPAQPEPNFAFSFSYGDCGGTLDTFEQTYSTLIKDGEPITIPVTLTDEQMMTIYQKMVAIDFFSYPETFRIAYDVNGVVGIQTPAPDYRIKVRNGELTHSVFWRDEIFEPTNREADQLRELIQIIMQVIKTNPDIQNLPELNFGCA
jgi:hypothetical protein